MAELDVTKTLSATDLEKLQDFPFVRIYKIDVQEGPEILVTIRPSVWELLRKKRKDGTKIAPSRTWVKGTFPPFSISSKLEIC